MNCARCNALLDSRGRFCHNCGLPVSASLPVVDTPTSPSTVAVVEDTVPIASMPEKTQTPSTLPAIRVPKTLKNLISTQPLAVPLPPQSPQARSDSNIGARNSEPQKPALDEPTQIVSSPPNLQAAQLAMPSPLVYYQARNSGVRMPPATVNTLASQQRRRSSRSSCFLGCLMMLVILLLILGAGWVFVLRPYLHNQAEQQIDQAMSSAIAQIPSQAAQVPSPLRVKDLVINNLITLNTAPSGPVQHANAVFTPQGIRLDFQLYGYPCTITGVPHTENGQLVMQGVTVKGIVSLIMSPDEMELLLDKQLHNAQARLQHSITRVSLQEHEIDLFLS